MSGPSNQLSLSGPRYTATSVDAKRAANNGENARFSMRIQQSALVALPALSHTDFSPFMRYCHRLLNTDIISLPEEADADDTLTIFHARHA